MQPVFVTGGTGYIGRPLVAALLAEGYPVHALVRSGSQRKIPPGAVPVVGSALEDSSFASEVPPGATFVHLVGTPHPNPTKVAAFRDVDLASIRASTRAAQRASVRHFIYVSVAHPAPIMQAYIAVRREGEALVQATGIPATVLRPWYVLGPGHYWPYLLVPAYALMRLVPSTRATAERLGLVTRARMVAALVHAVHSPPSAGTRVLEVTAIRRAQV